MRKGSVAVVCGHAPNGGGFHLEVVWACRHRGVEGYRCFMYGVSATYGLSLHVGFRPPLAIARLGSQGVIYHSLTGT